MVEPDLHGAEHTLRPRGTSDADVAHARAYIQRIHDAAFDGMPHEAFVREVMEPARGSPGFDYFGEVDAAMWDFLARNFQRPYEPADALAQISCPVLAIFGERDTLVAEDASGRIFEDVLARAGNDDTLQKGNGT